MNTMIILVASFIVGFWKTNCYPMIAIVDTAMFDNKNISIAV